MSRKALGKGLGALIPSPADDPTAIAAEPRPAERDRTIPVDRIRPNPVQPRTIFEPQSLEELAGSIRENGLIQPLVVREVGDGSFELIAGERRFLAAKQAGLTEVPVVTRQVSRREMLEIALVENLQREDLNPIEEAEAFQRLSTEFGMTQEDIAAHVGKSRAAVTNSMRLLGLEDDLRELVLHGRLSAGHARALLAVPEPKLRRALAKDILEKGLSVRDVEVRAQGTKSKRPKRAAKKRSHPAFEAWEGRLRDRFGTQVRIVGGLSRGRVEIHYFSEEDLERILELTGAGSEL
jgi:ParB family chromosome partitioning protein